ncbi:hypothetical protein [Haloferax volcanii]|uniref:Uncharacterized protein n=1 Tax=Haloferax volcanii TaxID=2246 RepID=A0A558FQE8_HALVO|nr:hypothetical protein [Haloferax volcanii]TVT87731.1 hypothetical protein FQA18_19280 [Haloferax volcanii]
MENEEYSKGGTKQPATVPIAFGGVLLTIILDQENNNTVIKQEENVEESVTFSGTFNPNTPTIVHGESNGNGHTVRLVWGREGVLEP